MTAKCVDAATPRSQGLYVFKIVDYQTSCWS